MIKNESNVINLFLQDLCRAIQQQPISEEVKKVNKQQQRQQRQQRRQQQQRKTRTT